MGLLFVVLGILAISLISIIMDRVFANQIVNIPPTPLPKINPCFDSSSTNPTDRTTNGRMVPTKHRAVLRPRLRPRGGRRTGAGRSGWWRGVVGRRRGTLFVARPRGCRDLVVTKDVTFENKAAWYCYRRLNLVKGDRALGGLML